MWEQIRANRRRSIGLLGVMTLILMALGYSLAEAFLGTGTGWIGLLAGLLILGVQLAISLSAAESMLLNTAIARPLKREDSPQLFNIVEEMKLASGLPGMPRILLVDDPSPNAFAMGIDPARSAVAVTSGLVYRLNRDELQGVIAHEISHINNHDVRFMTLAAATLGAIVFLSEMARSWTRFGGTGRSRGSTRGSGRSDGNQAQALFLIIAILIAILGPIMAQFLYFACSRRREFLADACGVQYTRYPEGLASALQKISAASIPVSFVNKVNAPLFIVNPLCADSPGNSFFDTHPSVQERIRVLRGMAGGALTDYETAYRQATGRSLLGKQTLQQASPLPLREPAADEPAETPAATRNIARRLCGYIRIPCPCGLEISVPETFERPEVHCARCGRSLPVPTAKELAAMSPKDIPPPDEKGPGYQYLFTRSRQGWESFRCPCGRTLELSPSFNSPNLTCPKCHRVIQIAPPAS